MTDETIVTQADLRLWCHSRPSQADAGISEPTKRMEQTLGAKFQSAALSPPTSGEEMRLRDGDAK